MTQPFPLEPYRGGIEQVVMHVFETMLNISPHRSGSASGARPIALTGAVYYAGAWKGALLVECMSEQAMDWAARMLSLKPPITPGDARDGLGELTNVIAGNMKPLLPAGVSLSFPSVVEGSDYSLRICGGNLSETLHFEDRIGLFGITLVEVVTP